MTMSQDSLSSRSDTPGTMEEPPAPIGWLGRILRLLLVLIILAAGGAVAYYWMTNKPKARRRRPEKQAVLVEVSRVTPATERVVVQAMGTVVASRTIQLASRVGGEIVAVSPEFVPGGHYATNERILQVDPRDYELVVRQRTSELTKAQSDLTLEMGQQSVAKGEYALLGQDVKEGDKELLLRQPQLAMANATVSAAQAARAKAQLDLARTDIVAPFNAVVQSRNVDLGAQVSVGSPLATLLCTDEYWVQASIPLDELRWIGIPQVSDKEGSTVRVYHEAAWGADAFRVGTVDRLMTDLEPQGRMARMMIAVKDPLDRSASPAKRHPLILGQYVRVEIEGRDLPGVVRIPRTALRDGNRVWVMTPDSTLDIHQVDIVWGGSDHVLVRDGLADGDLLVTSDLGAPVQGMALRTATGSGGKSPRQATGREQGESRGEGRS